MPKWFRASNTGPGVRGGRRERRGEEGGKERRGEEGGLMEGGEDGGKNIRLRDSVREGGEERGRKERVALMGAHLVLTEHRH
jgi:hypothetical protein